ncbi:MAG: hypothetical protein NTZ48_02750 [Candidatus Omnitrophica bacterium]|nr:hypothetical protein [Candidatus Omnitrophota bacterium]
MSLDLTLPLFVGTWLLSQLGNVPQVVIGDNALMLSHFALTMGSLYYLFHFPKKDVTGLASTAQDMGRSQILLQNIVERIPSGFRHLLGAFRGETINWNAYGQAATGLTNPQMIDKLKKTWLIGSAAALGMTFLAPTLWPVTFGLPLLGSLIASPFLIHTMGRAEEGILDVIKTVKGLGGDYAKVLDTLETVNYPNGLSNRLVQIMQQWNQKRIVYETEYNLVPEEYTLGIEEDAAFMTDAWSILTETEREGLMQAYGGDYETAKINFFETIAQAFVDKAKISDGYDIQEAVVSSLTSSNTQYKKLYSAFVNGVTVQKTLRSGETKNVKNEGAKGEKMANFLDVLTTASDPWKALNKTEKTIVIKSQGGADLSDEDAAALFNSFIADISQGRDDEILRSADTLISNLNIPIDTLTGYLMQAAPHIFNGTELTQEEATTVTKRMVYSMYLDGVLNNFEDEFEKLLTYSSAFEEYNVWEQNNPDATLDAQLTQLNAILDRIPR